MTTLLHKTKGHAIKLVAFAATIVLIALASTASAATIFLSDQARPVEEAQKVRDIILEGAPDAVEFVPEEGPVLVTKNIC